MTTPLGKKTCILMLDSLSEILEIDNLDEALTMVKIFNQNTDSGWVYEVKTGGKIINNYRLIETTLYVTLEPCIMCLGAIMHARVANIVFGAYDLSSGACGSSVDFTKLNCFNHKVNVTGGILEEDSRNLLHTFFKSKR